MDRFLAVQAAERGDVIGWIARIVLAVFVLVLFLFVDGSPESLGLALFMGFEALAKSLDQGWLPLGDTTFLQHFCLQMGDIFRLFFFCQLARIASKSVMPWLVWGTILSLPYGALRHYGPIFELVWPTAIPAYRDLVVGALGLIVVTRAAWFLRHKNLPWRFAALCIAAVAAFEQTVDPLGIIFPPVASVPGFAIIVDVLQPWSAYLFAMSAFINISSLENRVRSLSRAQTRVQAIERDMELGRALQRNFLNLPKLPPEYGIACHHEAARFVSGDTYYVHCNPTSKRLVFLMNDVTGQGVQAALKASVSSAVARTVWEEEDQDSVRADSLMATYERGIVHSLGRGNADPDLPSLMGGEFDPKTETAYLYRVNFTFPILVEPSQALYGSPDEPHLGEFWSLRVLPLPNRVVTAVPLKPGSFVVILSDGYLFSSRSAAGFLRYLRRALATRDGLLSANQLAQIILRFESFAKAPLQEDDRTLLVFQWAGPQGVSAKQLMPDHQPRKRLNRRGA